MREKNGKFKTFQCPLTLLVTLGSDDSSPTIHIVTCYYAVNNNATSSIKNIDNTFLYLVFISLFITPSNLSYSS